MELPKSNQCIQGGLTGRVFFRSFAGTDLPRDPLPGESQRQGPGVRFINLRFGRKILLDKFFIQQNFIQKISTVWTKFLHSMALNVTKPEIVIVKQR
jgi:hypothetical protein